MDTSSVYTKRSYGLDKNVWLVFVTTIILSICLLSYRMIGKKDCVQPEFTIRSLEEHTDSVHTVGETLSFTITNNNDDEITWDFGDKSDKMYGLSVTHRFMSEGSFNVSAGNTGGCENFKLVIIKKPEPVKLPGSNVPPGSEIAGPTTTVAGREETYFSMILGNNYEWENNKLAGVKQGMTVKFIFPVKGVYKLQLTLDGDKTKRYTKDIFVQDSIVQKAPEPIDQGSVLDIPVKTYKIISEEIFKAFLQKVVAGEYTVTDFDDFLYLGGKTPVSVNGDKAPVDFATVCQKLNGKRKKKAIFWKESVKVTKVVLHRAPDDETHVISIDINVNHNL